MSKKIKVTVAGCGISPECISSLVRNKVLQADVLAGGKRLLDFFPEFKGRKIIIKAGILDVISEIKSLSRSKKIAILASGDPLFHGIGAVAGRYFSKDELEIIPNISAMQALFSKLQISWNTAKLLSIHGGRSINFRNALSASTSVIYCDDKINASRLACEFAKRFPKCAERSAVIAENLGMDNEKIQSGTISSLSKRKCGGLSILLLLPSKGIADPGLALGLPDDSFLHENRMITHPEIRAVVLSKLKLGPGVLWDLGAGSGSVGIEAASLCQDLQVFAVESDTKRHGHLLKNIKKFALPNAKPIKSDALKAMTGLPNPRAVFIGGGGKDIKQITENAFRKLLPGGRLVVTAVLLETKAALTKCLKNNFVEAVSISISRSSALGSSRLMKSENSVDIYVYEK